MNCSCLDNVALVYSIVTVVGILLFDSQLVFPTDWFPSFLTKMLTWWALSLSDPVFKYVTPWTESYATIEVFLLLPMLALLILGETKYWSPQMIAVFASRLTFLLSNFLVLIADPWNEMSVKQQIALISIYGTDAFTSIFLLFHAMKKRSSTYRTIPTSRIEIK